MKVKKEKSKRYIVGIWIVKSIERNEISIKERVTVLEKKVAICFLNFDCDINIDTPIHMNITERRLEVSIIYIYSLSILTVLRSSLMIE